MVMWMWLMRLVLLGNAGMWSMYAAVWAKKGDMPSVILYSVLATTSLTVAFCYPVTRFLKWVPQRTKNISLAGWISFFTPLERRRLCRRLRSIRADGSLMLPSARREAPVLTGFTIILLFGFFLLPQQIIMSPLIFVWLVVFGIWMFAMSEVFHPTISKEDNQNN